MKRNSRLLKTIILILCFEYLYPQVNSTINQKAVDSLKREFKLAKHDTDKIKLRYELGMEMEIPLGPYWDSLARDAHRNNLFLTENKTYMIIASLYQEKGDKLKEIEFLGKSLRLAEESKKNVEIVKASTWLITNYISLLDFRKALDICYRALRLVQGDKNKKQLATLHYTVALIYSRMGDSHKAINAYKICLKDYMELKDYLSITAVQLEIGNNYRELKNNKMTIYYYTEASKHLKDINENWFYVSAIYNALGATYEIKHQLDSAYVYYNKSYHISKSNNNQRGMISSLVLLAENSFHRGLIKKAKTQAIEALEMVKSVGFKLQIPALALLLKKIHESDKDFEKALKFYELYTTTKDSASNEQNRKLATQKQFDYELEKKENQVKLLASQNQVQALELSKRNYLVAGMGVVLLLVLLVAYLLVQQNRIKVRQQRIEFTQKLLRSQINPHFMSNCLSAIQGLMLSGRVGEAAEYQAKFSVFLRQILDTTENFYIRLAEELNSIKLYLELEQLRFENNFEFILDTEPGLALNELLVPSFITQPFIENAIWHGLLPLKGRAPKLQLKIYAKNKYVFFEIEDNGIGRSNKPTKGTKSSKGSRIVMDNISNMNKLLKSNDNSVEIIDLFDEQKNPAGTKIIIRLKRFILDE